MSETARRAMLAPIETARLRYQLTGNPLFVLEGWRHARTLQVTIPDWILAYLDGFTAELFGGRLPAAAFGWSRRGPSAWAQYGKYTAHLALVRRVEELLGEALLRGEKLSVHRATITAADTLGIEHRTAQRVVREARRRNQQWFARK
jgi:hypothetical protein